MPRPSRYELTKPQWSRRNELLPGKAADSGRSGAGNRLFVNAVLWALRSGARWSDLPERYGKYKSVLKLEHQDTHGLRRAGTSTEVDPDAWTNQRHYAGSGAAARLCAHARAGLRFFKHACLPRKAPLPGQSPCAASPRAANSLAQGDGHKRS